MHNVDQLKDKIDERLAWHRKFEYAGGTKRDIILLECAKELLTLYSVNLIDINLFPKSKMLIDEALGYELKDMV